VFCLEPSIVTPFAGLIHELIHALDVSGLPEIDEGLATLFDCAAADNAVEWGDDVNIHGHWLNSFVRQPLNPENPYTFGAIYFACVAASDGLAAVWPARESLVRMKGSGARMDKMESSIRSHLKSLANKSAPAAAAHCAKVSDIRVARFYFDAEFETFATRVECLIADLGTSTLSDRNQLNIGRYLNLLAATEVDEDSEFTKKIALLDGQVNGFTRDAQLLIQIAEALNRAKTSPSRRALKRNALALQKLLEGNLHNKKIKADILLQLVQFHRYMPAITGADFKRCYQYIDALSEMNGMMSLAQRLKTSMDAP